MTSDNETDYEEGDDTSKLGKWILHLALNYFVLTILISKFLLRVSTILVYFDIIIYETLLLLVEIRIYN